MPIPLPLLVQAEGYTMLVLGVLALLFPHMHAQACFFLGDAVPYPRPWSAAPFAGFMTQKGLEAAWPQVTLMFRAIGVGEILLGVVMFLAGRSLLDHFRRYEEYLVKKGKRGEAVHSKVERYEQATGVAREVYSPPPLWLAVLFHAGAAVVAFSVRHWKPLGSPAFEWTAWATNLDGAFHAFWALAVLAAWIQARSIWGGQTGAAASPKNAGVKAE